MAFVDNAKEEIETFIGSKPIEVDGIKIKDKPIISQNNILSQLRNIIKIRK